ncbi:MAG: putative AsnC family transcriptional regulator [Nitrososphaera sp.]|nr:putative AsnC family transcriptional regulator [Nitrososphaera sp.]
MPVDLDNTDVAILKSLMEDGRKSFRAISREIKVSTPTVKSRYERLVNIGLIKSVKPEIDLSKVTRGKKSQFLGGEGETIKQLEEQKKHFHVKVVENMKVKMQCEYCGGPISSKPKVLEFANFQRFFCCVTCKNNYREKHAGRIESIVEQYRGEMKDKKIDAKKLLP